MVELQTPQLNAVFHALGDATRRQMIRELSVGQRTVSQLAEPYAISLAAASKHIKEPGPLASAYDWLNYYERFWTRHLDVLEDLLRNDPAHPAPDRKKGEEK
jgi:DNA-binding transcriptional ArsR family regulator